MQLAFNTGYPISTLAETLGRQPGKIVISIQANRKRKRQLAAVRNKQFTYAKRAKLTTTDKNYGPNANKPDVDSEEMEIR